MSSSDWLGRLSQGYADWTRDVHRWARDDQPLPSRDAVVRAAMDPKDRDKERRERFARNQAERAKAREDPRNVVEQERGGGVPSDPRRTPVGTGTGLAPLVSHGPGTPATAGAAQGDDYKVVRMPDGRVVVTRDPVGVTAAQGGRVDPPGGRANVVSGSAGTVYSSPEGALFGPGGADLGETELPGRDRSPGWAARAAINELYRAGDLSMDPRAIMERRRFEESETARDMARERAEIEHQAAVERAMMPPVDPYLMAEIEAQGKYGARGLQEETQNQRIMAALNYYAQISQRINAIEAEMAGLEPGSEQYNALSQTRDRLVQERREMPNLALGFSLRDPKLDPLTAMLGFMGASGPRTEEGT